MIRRRFFSSSLAKYGLPKPGQKLHNFNVLSVTEIDELNLSIVKMEHERTGAAHWHIAREDPNCVFCIAFRTPVSNSTGVPHILEHTTLCGSDKYPVRDPFFKMLNRSMASYVNAWTASEHTAYPFCTANSTDYNNLRDVYSDAVFRPSLKRLDFLQEGWRLENEDPKNETSPLKFKGVVYNEMKGAFSDVESLFAQRLQQERFPQSLYSHVSGGDPPRIPDLTHEQLVEFHRTHYHPSNALVYTYGNLDLPETLQYLDSKFEPFSRTAPVSIQVPSITESPRTVEVTCPLDPALNPDKQCKMSLSFLMNDVTVDPQETFHLKILSHLLLEGSSAPLYQALIDSNIGQEYAPGTGYDSSTKVASFSVGLQGIREEDIEMVKETIEKVLGECKHTGFSSSRIDSVLHLLELGTKRQSAQYGLSLSHRIISSWVFGLEPESELALKVKISKFKEAFAKGGLFEGLIDKYFLQSKSPLLFIMKPSADYNKKLEEAEAKLLDQKVSSLTAEDRQSIFQESSKLLQEQDRKENIEVLPCLKFEDLSREIKKVEMKEFHHQTSPKIFWRSTPTTNGVSFIKTLLPVNSVDAEDLMLLPLACEVLTDLGVQGKTLEVFDEEIKRWTGGLSSSLLLGRTPWAPNAVPELALYTGTHGLDRNVPRALDLLHEALVKADFSNLARLRSIISGNASSMMNSIAASGHAFAISKASSTLSLRGRMDEKLSGLSQALYMNELASLEDLSELSEKLRKLSSHILSAKAHDSRAAAIASDDSAFEAVSHFHKRLFKPSESIPSQSVLNLPLAPIEEHIQMPFATSYAAKVFQFNPYNLTDAANLSVLAKILRSAYLHKEIREKGGAYGGGASYSTLNGLFSFYSYRDPNPKRSLEIFDSAPGWFLSSSPEVISVQVVLEGQFAVFSALDAPVDVGSEGLHTFYHGITDVDRQLYRDELFAVDRNSLKQTVATLFGKDTPSQKCIIGPSQFNN